MKTRWWSRHPQSAKNGRNGRALRRALERAEHNAMAARQAVGLLRENLSDPWAADSVEALCESSDELRDRCQRLARKCELQATRIDKLEHALGMGRAIFGELRERLARLDDTLAEVQSYEAPDADTAALFGELRTELRHVFADGVAFAEEIMAGVQTAVVPPRPKPRWRWRSRWARKWRRYLDAKLGGES